MTKSLSLSIVLVVSNALAQSTISNTNRHAYASNAGWIDWNLSPSNADGVVVTDTFLSGYAYSANFGYINFGNGTPTNGHTYANTTATNCGVNLSLDGLLTGYAYGANIGWIQFEQTFGLPRLNLITGQLSGYAYSANIGWIALSTTVSTLTTRSISRPDSDGDGIADPWERIYFGSLGSAAASTDKDGDGASDLMEYFAGTDPTDPASRLRITAQSYSPNFNQATLTWTVVPSRQYRIEHTTDLLAPWTDGSGTMNPAAGSTATRTIFLSASAGPPRRFFRVVSLMPLP